MLRVLPGYPFLENPIFRKGLLLPPKIPSNPPHSNLYPCQVWPSVLSFVQLHTERLNVPSVLHPVLSLRLCSSWHLDNIRQSNIEKSPRQSLYSQPSF